MKSNNRYLSLTGDALSVTRQSSMHHLGRLGLWQRHSAFVNRENLDATARGEMVLAQTNNIPNDGTDFVNGIDLARMFYIEVVRPLIEGRAHSAARLGSGSDVLGFDIPRSTDHGWGHN